MPRTRRAVFCRQPARCIGCICPRGEAIRVDTGVRQGDTVTPFYDPMIAKIIAHGEDRAAARARLSRALADTAVLGVATNLGFLARIVADADFAAGAVDTGFIERRRETLLAPADPPPALALAAAALDRLLSREAAARAAAFRQTRGRGATAGGSISQPRRAIFCSAAARPNMRWRRPRSVPVIGGWRLPASSMMCAARAGPDGMLAVVLDGVRRTVRVLDYGGVTAVFFDGESWIFEAIDPLAPPAGADAAAGRLTAPMPGRVVQVLVRAGDAVRQGQPMMVVEAMKMEHTIAAPRDGTVAAVHFAPGDLVEEGAELIALADGDKAPER